MTDNIPKSRKQLACDVYSLYLTDQLGLLQQACINITSAKCTTDQELADAAA